MAAQQLVQTTEVLIQAALKESVAVANSTSKETLEELRQIHAALDKQLAHAASQKQQASAGSHEALQQAVERALEKSSAGMQQAIQTSLDKHFRVLRLQQAMALVQPKHKAKYEWYYSCGRDSSYIHEGVDEIRRILVNAIRGAGTHVPKEWTLPEAKRRPGYGGDRIYSHEVFRNQLSEWLHGLTGIEPRFEEQEDGSCMVHL